ncbi:MAG: hypothetical protein F6K47_39240 [Symploca sp. SIO2E6]|nr:hypothetical protein [Symploca sp. SIO2E6]
MAHLTTLMTQGKPQMRQRGKWDVVRKLLEKGYHQEDIRKLYRAVDWMMALPPKLQDSFEEQLKRYQQERQMPLLSNMEIRAMQRGIEQGIERGIEQGIEQGIERGTVQTARESVLEVLTMRFEMVLPELIEAINQIEDASVLKQLLKQAIAINSLAQFQQLLSPNEASTSGE